MAKVVGCACGVLAIFLVIIYNSKKCAVNALNKRAYYDVSLSYLPHIDAESEPIQLSKLRTRRDTLTDAKTQYNSVTQNGSAAAASAGAVNATVTGAESIVSSADSSGLVPYNVHNVGVNGAGQRKNVPLNVGGETTITVDNGPADVKKPGQAQFPKKVGSTVTMSAQQQQNATNAISVNAASAAGVAASAAATTAASDATSTEKTIFEEVDITEDETENEAKQHNLIIKEDHHVYYNSSMMVNKNATNRIWNGVKNISHNLMLSQSHRRAMTVELSFNFPFYGHSVKNITIATGGFIYTGEYVHSWLAATQYIAPLMANFDTSISNDSFVRMNDNGTAFTVVWENVVLQDKPTYGKFTFSATLHKSGDIVFTYFSVPIMIKSIQDNQHPVKVGLSDAYIIDKYYYFARRKTIYEYHRVSFSQKEIGNGTIIYLTALPTCLSYTECNACIKHTTNFDCVWCPQLNRCSTGTDRKKQEWIQKGCERAVINDVANCPAIGQKGNNAGSSNAGANENSSTGNSEVAHTPPSGGGADASETTSAPSASSTVLPAHELSAGQEHRAIAPEHTVAAESKSVGVAFGFLVPICLVFAVTLWLFYAYRNPHTRSGQLLIQFRPSQWSWRRGEARYTAATIHM